MAALTEDVVLARSRAKSLTAVKKLNCWGTGLSDISVLRKMPNVEVVTLSVNEISSLKDFAYCPKLKELYVRRNSVADLDEIQFLKNLPFLKVLWLSDNPCSQSNSYRSTVLKNLPNIQRLDNIEVCSDEVDKAATDGEEFLVPDDIPVYNEVNLDTRLSGNSLTHGLSFNGNAGSQEHQNIELSAHELLDETNKLRTQLGLKPLIIEEETVDEKREIDKIPVPPPSENGLSTNTKNSNILSAVLLLLNDMDEEDLRIVQREIDGKLEILEEGNDELICEKEEEVLT